MHEFQMREYLSKKYNGHIKGQNIWNMSPAQIYRIYQSVVAREDQTQEKKVQTINEHGQLSFEQFYNKEKTHA